MNSKLTVYNPTKTLSPFHPDEFLTPFDRLFDNLLSEFYPHTSQELGDAFFEQGSYPKVDVISYSDKVLIEAEIPGLTKEDVTVNVTNNSLVISGNKQTKTENVETKGGKYVRRELKRSGFQRSFDLGTNLDKTSIKASFKEGVLTVEVAKIKPTEPEIKKIAIT